MFDVCIESLLECDFCEVVDRKIDKKEEVKLDTKETNCNNEHKEIAINYQFDKNKSDKSNNNAK